MARFHDTVEDERTHFEGLLTSYMPWGACIFFVDEDFVQHHGPGEMEFWCTTVTVLDVALGQEGPYYNAAFGPTDVYGLSSDEGTDPANSAWTLLVTDPIVEIPNGRFALEVLDPGGAHHNPERWLMGVPAKNPRQLLATSRGDF